MKTTNLDCAQDLELAYKLRHALDENLTDLPASISERLASSRKIALSHKTTSTTAYVTQPQLAGHAAYTAPKYFSWISRMSVLVPLAALVFGLIGIYQFEQRQQIIDVATLDAGVLTDDLPLSAYLDNGFGAFLAKGDN